MNNQSNLVKYLVLTFYFSICFFNKPVYSQKQTDNELLLKYFLKNAYDLVLIKKADSAQSYLDKAAELVSSSTNPNFIKIYYLEKSKILEKKGLYDSAAKELNNYTDLMMKIKSFDGLDNTYFKMAELYKNDFQFVNSRKKLDSVGLFSVSPDKKLIINKIIFSAKIFLESGNYDSVKSMIKLAQEALKNDNFVQLSIDCDILLARIDVEKMNYKIAIKNFKEILSQAKKNKYAEGEAECFKYLGNISILVNEPDLALEKFQKALDIYNKLNDITGAADCHFGLGKAMNTKGVFDTAFYEYQIAFKFYEEIINRQKLALTAEELGDIYLKNENGLYARELYEMALRIFIKHDYVKGIATVYAKLGKLFSLFNLHDESIIMHENSYRANMMIPDSISAAKALINIAEENILSGKGKYAPSYYEIAFDILKKKKSYFELGISLMRRGDSYFNNQKYDKSLSDFMEALGYFVQIKNELYKANIKFRIAEVQFKNMKYVESRKYFQETIAFFSKIGDNIVLPLCRFYLSLLNQRSETKNEVVIKNFEENIIEFSKYNNYHGLALAYYYLGDFYAKINNYQNALEVTKKGYENYQKSLNQKNSNLSKLSNINIFQNLMSNLIKISFALGKKNESIEYVNILNDNVHVNAIRKLNYFPAKNVSKSIKEEINNSVLINNYLSTLLSERNKSGFLALKNNISVLEEKIKNNITDLRKNEYEYANFKYPESASLKNLQAKIDNDEIYLQYFVNEDELYSFAVTNDTVIAFKDNITAKDLLTLQSDLLMGIIRYDSVSLFVEKSRSLYKKLIGPFGNILKSRKILYIIPDKFLSYLPFECLLTKDINNDSLKAQKMRIYSQLPYLILDHSIIYETSISNTQKLKTNDKKYYENDGIISFKAPIYIYEQMHNPKDTSNAGNRQIPFVWYMYEAFRNDSLIVVPPLPASLDESMMITSQFSKLPILEFAAENATEENFKNSGFVGKYKNLYLGTYGIINNYQPHLSGIVLTEGNPDSKEDGYIGLNDLLNMKINCDLAVVSRLLIGPSEIDAGAGFKTFCRALNYTNINSVLYNFWDANSSAPMFYGLFYERFNQSNISKIDALQQTKMDIAVNRGFPPFFWSGYILYGKP